jgi:GT2 family glycosyltransferase
MGISVVTAVHNGAAFLNDAIGSILAQTEQDFEYIIVNDGSTDRTQEILGQIQDPRVKIIHQAENMGAAHCLNLAISQAGGDWIAVQDADDISLPNRLERQVDFLKNHPETGLAGSYVKCLYEGRELQKRAKATEQQMNSQSSDLIYGSSFCHGTFMFSKKIFQAIGGYSPKFKIAYDYDLLVKFWQHGPVRKIPEVLYSYRLQEKSLSSRDLFATNKESMEVSIKAIHACMEEDPRDFLILGTPAACRFFQAHFEVLLLPKKCYYGAAPSSDLAAIVLDHRGSQQLIRTLRGSTYFKVWCLFNGED